ncbi:MAG: YceD family protein [Gammaproteobacteria bacterium]
MSQLPTRIDPIVIAAETRVLEGLLPLAGMPRVRAIVEQPLGMVKLRLRGAVDEADRSLLLGHVEAHINLQCQRCLQAVAVQIDTDFALAVVHSEREAALLADDYEPLLVPQGGDVSLAELIEDEVLLNLPVVARHEVNECATDAQGVSTDTAVAADDVYQPFAGLADLLAKRPD